MKKSREIMEILEAYDLTGSYRAAAELVGCDHHTVARYVQLRETGQSPEAREHRVRPIDEYVEKIEELVVRSSGRVRADVVHRRITAMGFAGGERTTRRVVAEMKERLRAGQRRVFRPWIPEPGLWMQWDWGEGPRITGRRTSLWCAWLAWSRFRVVIGALLGSLHHSRTYHHLEPRYLNVRVHGSPVAVATDGEVGPEGNHFLFRSRPGALGIYRP